MNKKNNLSKESGIIHLPFIRKILTKIVDTIQLNSLKYYHGHLKTYGVPGISENISEIKREIGLTMRPNEYWMVSSLVSIAKLMEGDIAEVGVYKGASAKIICEEKLNSTKLYLFDTFEGTPEISEIDTQFEQGMFKSNFDKVKNYLSKYQNVYICKGIFPEENSDKIKDKTFSLVHLDVDTEKSTYESLKFFYPRMIRGGYILIHDYSRALGVQIAVDRFILERKEEYKEEIRIIRLAESQALIIKEEK